MNNKRKPISTEKKDDHDLVVEFTKYYSGSPSDDCQREAAFRKAAAECFQLLPSETRARMINLDPKERGLLLLKLMNFKKF